MNIRSAPVLTLCLALFTWAIEATAADQLTRVVVAIAEPGYGTDKTLPALAEKIWTKDKGYEVEVIIGDPKLHDLAGLAEALKGADVLVTSVRRQALPKDQLQAIRDHLAAGKSLLAIRTSSHGFTALGKGPEGHAEWGAFDSEVLGAAYETHAGNDLVATFTAAVDAEKHSLLDGVELPFSSGGGFYFSTPLAKTATPILMGRLEGMDAEPVAWTNRYGANEARVFYTCLGQEEEFALPAFQKLMANAMEWLRAPEGATAAAAPVNLSKENLVAWCIVPFDAKQRGPAERAVMLKELGITRCAYDWRKEHVASFEQEIIEYQKQGIEFFAFWGGHDAAFELFEKYDLHPQIWRTLPSQKGDNEAEKIESAAQAMQPLAKRAMELGCKLGLYNHGGWGGEPENMVAVCERLKAMGYGNVGIVYNFHHGHGHINDWAKSFTMMQPYLLCLNLNGMVEKGDAVGKKILALGDGDRELAMLQVVVDSGYKGPVGILDHRPETDSAETLRGNLLGLTKLRSALEPRD